MRAQQLLLGHVEAELKRNGLPPLVWYDVLLELQRQPDGRLRLAEIGKQVLLSKYNVTRLVDRLENKGLVEREPCEDDARGAYAAITEDGRALLPAGSMARWDLPPLEKRRLTTARTHSGH